MALGHEWIGCDFVPRVVSDVQPKRDCTGEDVRFRLMGDVPEPLLTPVELVRAAFFLLQTRNSCARRSVFRSLAFCFHLSYHHLTRFH